jgi:pilus assembly protein CpaB
MSRRRRAAVLLGLALVLGGLAASDVARREGALTRRLGPLQSVLVARTATPEGATVKASALARREVPARFAPPGALAEPHQVAGLQSRVRLPAGAFVTADVLRDPAQRTAPGGARPGERIAEIIARGDPETIVAGSRVDVLVTREAGGGGAGHTRLALQDVDVLDARPAPAAQDGENDPPPGERVAVSLRVTVRQAVYLTAAESFAREIRLLARAPGDRRRTP